MDLAQLVSGLLFTFEGVIALIGHHLQLNLNIFLFSARVEPGQKPPSTIMVSPRTRPGCARGSNPSFLGRAHWWHSIVRTWTMMKAISGGEKKTNLKLKDEKN